MVTRIHRAVILSMALLLVSCGRNPRKAEAEATATPVPVQTVTIEPSTAPNTYEAVGTVRARATAVISSKVMGYVREVTVQTGDHVREGQKLVVLDSRDLEAAYRQAEAARNEARSAIAEADNGMAGAKANLELAQVTFRRMEDLFKKKSISNQEYDEASARVKSAQANYEMALSRRTQLTSKIQQAEEGSKAAAIMKSYAEVTAPFSGIVTEKRVEPGNLATPGAPLLAIEREGSYRLEVPVEESRLPSVRTGQSVSVTLDALDRTLQARIAEIVPSVDAASRAFIVKIDLPALPQLRSGIYGRARFSLGERQVLTVPAAAVMERGQLQSVLVVEDGTARARLITAGQKSDSQVEVLSGLSSGEKVVSPIPAGLSDGAKVEVRQ